MIFKFFKNKFISYIILVTFTTAFFMAPGPAYATAGDGLVVYGEGTVTTPRYRTYTPTAFGSESNAQTANATIQWVAMKTKPGATERIMGTLSSAASNNLTIQRWNGSSWASPVEWQFTSNMSAYRSFDIIYENLSGKALVVYSGDSSNPTRVYFRYWNGSTWSSPANFTFTTGIGDIQWIRLASKLNSNEIAVIAVGSDNQVNVNGRIWDPDTNTFPASTEPSGGLGLVQSPTTESFDAVYETASGDLMVAWSASVTARWANATRTGSTWTINNNPPELGTHKINHLALAASPLSTSNRLAVVALCNNSALSVGRWDGSNWTNQNHLDDNSTSATHAADVAFAGTTDNAIVVYSGVESNVNVDWVRSVAGGAFSIQTDYNPGGTPSNPEAIVNLTADASSSKLMLLRAHQTNLYLRAHVYNEATQSWSTPTGDPLETNISGGETYDSFAFAWESVFNIPTLGVALTVVVISSFIAIMVKRRVILLKPSPA